MPKQKSFDVIDETGNDPVFVEATTPVEVSPITLTVVRYGDVESLVETDAGFFYVDSSVIQNSVVAQEVPAETVLTPAESLDALVEDVTFGIREILRALHRNGVKPTTSREEVVRVLSAYSKFSIRR